MNRREALKTTAMILGTTIVGAEAFLSGCSNSHSFKLSDDDLVLLNTFAETILPATDTPGAREADAASFMKKIVSDFYTNDEQNIFLAGIKTIGLRSKQKFNKDYIDLSHDNRNILLNDFENEAGKYYAEHTSGEHFYIMLKQLTIWAYLSSEVTAKNAFIFSPLIAKYIADIEYHPADKIVYNDFGRSAGAYQAAINHIKND